MFGIFKNAIKINSLVWKKAKNFRSYSPQTTNKYKIQKKNQLAETDNVIILPAEERGFQKSKISSSLIFEKMSELTRFGIKLKSFPSVIVIGPQSSGKSSVIEAICGKNILPKAMKMSTKKPTILSIIRSDEDKFKIGDKEFHNESEAAEEIDRLNNNNYIEQIPVIIHSKTGFNCELIDLPGLFVVASKEEEGLPSKIKKMSVEHLINMNYIPLIIHSAPTDPATNSALKLTKKYGRDEDSFGIITKMDMVENQKTQYFEELFDPSSRFSLGHGYCPVILRNDQEIANGKTIEEKIQEEKEYFHESNLVKYTDKIKSFGVEEMRKKISDIQFEKIKKLIPNIINDIDKELENLKASESFLSNLHAGREQKIISRLRIMIEKLVSSSHERAKFEKELKIKFEKEILKYTKDNVFNKILKESAQENHYQRSQTVSFNGNLSSYLFSKNADPKDYSNDQIKELFSYGLISPIFIDSKTIKEAKEKELNLAISGGLVDIDINDPLSEKRSNWNKGLITFINKLSDNDNIHKIIYEVTEKSLLEFIYDDVEHIDPIERKFSEYLIKEISNDAYQSNIKYSITAMLNIEKRPLVSLYEIIRYLAQKNPSLFTFPDTFLDRMKKNNKCMTLEIYSDEWNEAHLHVVVSNFVNNCYRNVAVNLMDKMIENLLRMIHDMFNKENTMKEKNKVEAKKKQLQEIRNILLNSV